MSSMRRMETVKTTFKLTREAVSDLDQMSKTLRMTKRKVIDNVMFNMGEGYNYYPSMTCFKVMLEGISYESDEFVRVSYSLSRESLDVLSYISAEFGQSRDALLDSSIKVGMSLSMGENKILAKEIRRIAEIHDMLTKEIGDILEATGLVTWGDMLTGPYEELSRAWSELRRANDKLDDVLKEIAEKEGSA